MKRLFAALLVGILVVVALVAYLNFRGEDRIHDAPPITPPSGEKVARGAYLAKAGNCMACHTERGGAPFAGGRAIDTPFGTVYSSNLTPHRDEGIGSWSPDHFWRALHNGRSRDGRLLYPAFPYPNYTLVTRTDSDAIYDYLRSLPPAARANTPNRLRWPYNTQAALAVWRALYFSPGTHEADLAQSAEWNRGAYLVQGLGHCSACHSPRNALGANSDMMDLSGGLIPMQNWY
ncbi:MAG: c-type cytochrome, partial [Ramlibacter sp.]